MQLSRNSHKKIEVECEFKISEKCTNIKKLEYRAWLNNKERNNGKYICFYCSRTMKYSGRNNPNCKYIFNDSFFKNIDSEDKAYLLGWIASDGYINESGFVLSIKKEDKNILDELKNVVCKNIPIKKVKNNTQVSLTVNSKEISKDLCKHLNINPGKKSYTVKFPKINKELERHFIRGYFDGDGCVSNIRKKKPYPICSVASCSNDILNKIKEACNISCSIYAGGMEWSHNNALDFLYYIYNDCNLKLERKHKKYLEWASWVPSMSGYNSCIHIPHAKVNKCNKNAVFPSKERASDSGYDITIIDIKKKFDYGNVVLYGTGLKIAPDYGWYFDLVPRSSISKTGYMLANSTGILDRTYRGEIMVALVKIDKNAPDLELPCRIGQIIPRPIVHVNLIEVDNLEETERNEGGFGSTGK